MPNWADVTRKVSGKKESIAKLHETIKKCEATKEPLVKNGFGNLWLGCIVNALGGDWEKVRCRGEIETYSISDDGTELIIDSSEAWGEQSEFRDFLEEKLDDIGITYYCAEPGMCEYYTNDMDCTAMVIEVEGIDEDGNADSSIFYDSYRADDADDALCYFEGFYDELEGEEYDTVDDVIRIMKTKGYEVSVHEYEYNED